MLPDVSDQYAAAEDAKELAAEKLTALPITTREQLAQALAGPRRWSLATQQYLEGEMGTTNTLVAKCKRVWGSDRLMFCISRILGVDWVDHPRAMGGLVITSDGHVQSGGLYIGTAEDLQRNLEGYMEAAELTESERSLFSVLFVMHVEDWRKDPPPGMRGRIMP